MSEVRDTAVKLFGWTITSVSSDHAKEDSSPSCSSSPPHSLRPEVMNNQSASDNSVQDNPSLKIPSESKETSENSDDQHSDITTTSTSEEKTTDLKKPNNILPCPRCNSVDTKFCYYNNYNFNQPRHFCRKCQRYWTSGGTMRTVPVGSGRRKKKGWVSPDITSENDYSNSSTKFISFESSDSVVTKQDKYQSNAQELNNFQGFLPLQVTSSVSSPLPYQDPPNPSFYHMPVYWGYTPPVWVYPRPCLGKRTRDETSHENVEERTHAFVTARLLSKSESINNEASIPTKDHVWYPVPMKREKTEQFSSFIHGSERKSSYKKFVPQTYLNLQANPAAMARSMNFRESM